MNTVTTIKPHLASIECPDVLRALPGWLTWRFETHEGEPKPRKVPYYAGGARRHGVQGRPEDREQLTTFDAARSAAARRGMDGIGFCPMPEWGVCALDFDNCVTDGGLHPDVERAIVGTYAEFSPSGNGVRAFVRGQLGNRKAHGAPFGFETFSSKGFITVTGNTLPVTEMTDSQNTVAEPSPELLALCAVRFGRAEPPEPGEATGAGVEPIGLTVEQLRDALDVLPKDLDYDAWLKVGMALHHETGGEGFELWDEWGTTSGKYSTREYGEMKWASFGRHTGRPTTAHYLVRMANEQGAHIDIAAAAAGDFTDISEQDSTPTGVTRSEKDSKPNRFAVLPAHEFAAGAPPTWIVKGVVPQAELMVMFGESGSGKSFAALDLGGAIARGVEWRGKRTRQGRVVYIAAEGAGGFRNRLKAYAGLHNVELADVPIGVIHAAPNMLLKDDALDVCKAIIAAGGADLVIVDTFAQVTPGANENAAEDMGKALAHCKGIHRATGALVLLVHHAGKDASKGARGWSGLKAAADAELEVLRTPAGRMLRVSKQKDGEDGLVWGFELEQVPVGVDEDGEIVTSMVVRECAAPAIQQVGAIRRKLGKWETLVVEVINELAKAQTAGIEVEAVVTEALAKAPKPDGKDTRKQYVKRALQALVDEPDSPYFLEDGCLSIG
jgi:hypothetical protein